MKHNKWTVRLEKRMFEMAHSLNYTVVKNGSMYSIFDEKGNVILGENYSANLTQARVFLYRLIDTTSYDFLLSKNRLNPFV